VCEETILNLTLRSSGRARPGSVRDHGWFGGDRRPARRTVLARTAAIAGLAALVAGCGIFSNTPGPSSSPTGSPTPAMSISLATGTPTATPAPTPRLVKSVTLVASIGQPEAWTPAGLTWTGIQAAAARVGAATALVQPASNADLEKEVTAAAGADGAVVVTVGAAADPAVQAAAVSYPATQFLEMDIVLPGGSPANVHGIAFDEAEAGYLGGYVAAAFADSGKIGMVGDTATDTRSINYAAGFRSGASQANPAVGVTVAYAGSPDLPDRGRAAAAGLVKAGAGVVMAMPSLAGIGALREACARKALLVAVGTDAWQIVPDIQPCLIVSVMNRYDVAVTAAILAIGAGQSIGRLTVEDVADGGIALSDFHAALPAGFQDGLDAVLSALASGPPRPTPAPPSAAPTTAPSASPKPST